MGDHGEIEQRAYDWIEGEAVENMVRRIMTDRYRLNKYSSQTPYPGDVIEVRVIVGSDVEPLETPDDPF